MRFEKELNKYRKSGRFSFKRNETLEERCNAPTNQSGIYLIYKVVNSDEILLYIGSSGQGKNGQLKTRKSGLGGMKDRIVNGYHPKFGKIRRKVIFPQQMVLENINELIFYWWVTYDDEYQDYPTDVEYQLCEKYRHVNKKLPDWHK